MRVWIWLVIFGGLIAWVIGPRLGPGPADTSAWTFERVERDSQAFEIARTKGQIYEDATRKQLRQAVLTAAARLEFSPCDKQLRPPLRAAVAAFLLRLRNTADQQIETATIDGEPQDATLFLNGAAFEVIREARSAGVIYKEDMPPEVAMLFLSRPPRPDHRWSNNRFVCHDGDGD